MNTDEDEYINESTKIWTICTEYVYGIIQITENDYQETVSLNQKR